MPLSLLFLRRCLSRSIASFPVCFPVVLSKTMSLESPRMVTAANHWTAFPTAVFAGSGIVEQQLHPIKSQQQQRKAMKRLPLMPKASGLMSGGSTHPHKRQIFPRNRGKVGTGKYYVF